MKTEKPAFATSFITPIFRLSFPYVWTPRMNQLSKKEEYSIQMLFDKKEIQMTPLVISTNPKTKLEGLSMGGMADRIKKLIEFKGWAALPNVRRPFADADVKKDMNGVIIAEKNPSAKGMIIATAKSKTAPGIADCTGANLITVHDEIYGGCYCKALVNIYAYDQAGNKGISIGLNGLQKVRDGEPFGNRVRAEDAFSPVEGEASQAGDVNEMFG